ncbi:hypothetical protein ACO1Y7_22180 [Klebsiella quasipneumoniae subsp. similipneumoniae]|uniref:Uncharacterized protein n=2 Tax=Enterobacteriaceae TaxID=543 RepID=A0A5C9AC60_ECOLX|nr:MULTISPECIES: hypothetical protein [Enterobacteriaceae]EAA8985520.1 hypothetical protein [Salmonella enterica]EBG5980820.1 hypothetical protein [Salmonella enterica subsp. enterica serovar Minnesota]EBH8447563.1 hypothetical protein [Salmonella enterica subsp. enterica serovar Ouakam]EBQ8953530.1 hypothetical protein [Salmonella enterica subsp. enterica serovar Montevideo]ECE7610419.1 hypothetical protein [Salmonella enterica subsp. enterica serovar Infantis]EDX8937524.1 hypothetical prote
MKDRYTLNQGRNALIDSEADQPVRIFFTNNVYVCKTSTGMFKERSPEELARLLNRTANQQKVSTGFKAGRPKTVEELSRMLEKIQK